MSRNNVTNSVIFVDATSDITQVLGGETMTERNFSNYRLIREVAIRRENSREGQARRHSSTPQKRLTIISAPPSKYSRFEPGTAALNDVTLYCLQLRPIFKCQGAEVPVTEHARRSEMDSTDLRQVRRGQLI